VDYTSSIEVVLKDYQATLGTDSILHIHPFGSADVQPEPGTSNYSFLPQYDYEGELYIGVADLRPPQTISVLFQMAEGSADPDLDPPPIEWSCLSNNRWINLDNGNILQDATRGLTNSGIIEFSLPLVEPNSLLSPSLYWIRAAIANNSNGVCDTVA